MKNILYIISSVILGAAGQIFLKTGMNKIGAVKEGVNLSNTALYYVKAVFSPFVFTGLFLYGISMIMWLWVLSKYDLSYARPFVALGYIITALYSMLFLGENISFLRWAGIILIIAGVILVART